MSTCHDRRTIPLLLKIWAEAGREHGGVIIIDDKTISPSNISGQVRALSNVVREAASGTGQIVSASCIGKYCACRRRQLHAALTLGQQLDSVSQPGSQES
jgi:hypothetical protein